MNDFAVIVARTGCNEKKLRNLSQLCYILHQSSSNMSPNTIILPLRIRPRSLQPLVLPGLMFQSAVHLSVVADVMLVLQKPWVQRIVVGWQFLFGKSRIVLEVQPACYLERLGKSQEILSKKVRVRFAELYGFRINSKNHLEGAQGLPQLMMLKLQEGLLGKFDETIHHALLDEGVGDVVFPVPNIDPW
jgi:hypothetical protein